MIEDYSKYPRHYYKYAPFNKYTISSLINSEYWFSDPKDFNDPYDCSVELDFDINEEDLRNWFTKTNLFYTELITNVSDPLKLVQLIKIHYRNRLDDDGAYNVIDRIYSKDGRLYSHDLIEERIREFKNDKDEFIRHIKDVSKEEIENYRILCLSKKKNSSTMWAHYADSHRGICIKFDSKADERFFTFPLKVEYTGRYPCYNYINEWDQHKAARFILRTKQKSWNYEQEYRIAKHTKTTQFKQNGLLEINRAAIKEIYFGLYTDKSDIQLFKEINKKYYGGRIKAFKAETKAKSFDIGFKPLL